MNTTQSLDPKRCAEKVYSSSWSNRSQCARPPGHGPNGLYCKQHAASHDDSEGEEWFRCSGYGWNLETVRVTKHTDSRVWLKQDNGTSRQEARQSDFTTYWPTREEAINFLKRRAQGKLDSARATISEMEKVLKNLESL